MGDKAQTHHPGAAGRAKAADHPASIRNVVLVGHSGSGKTTLVEALALTAGAVNRAGRVEDGGTVSDHDDIEHRQQRSVQLSLVPVEWDDIKINLLDTPGYADFVGELRAGLRAADAALFVVSASDGVDGSTRMVWEECQAVGMPRAIVVTHLESARGAGGVGWPGGAGGVGGPPGGCGQPPGGAGGGAGGAGPPWHLSPL
ncbi:GTP-binding protein, partial [Streptomyces sp. NPDC004011]